MMESGPDQLIHQAFFGWSHDVGALTVLAHSLPPGHARRWLTRLAGHLRLQPAPDAPTPPHALSYHSFDDGLSAVLRRVDVGYSAGRNNSHALIGPTDRLEVSVALGLDEWPGWQETPPNGLESFSATFQTDLAARRLRPVAERCAPRLTTLLARLLAEPGRPVSVIGCPDQERLAMVWGLHAAADHYLTRHSHARRWSFSTYVDRHDDSIDGLPEIVFLPVRPRGSAVATRVIVDLGRDDPPPAGCLERASELVAEVLRVGSGLTVVVGPQPSADRHTAQSERPPAADGDGNGETRLHPAQSQPVQRGGPGPHLEPRLGRQLLDDVLTAGSVQDFDSRLRTLGSAARQRQQREVMRSVLHVRAVDDVVRLIETSVRQELLDRVLAIAYGPDLQDLDDPSALEHARKLVRDSESDEPARILARAARQGGKRGSLREAAFDRLTGTVRPARSGLAIRVLGMSRRSRNLLAVAVLAVLAAVFLLGFVAGQPAEGSQIASPSGAVTTSTPFSPSLTTAAERGALPTGLATLAPSQDQQVFGFVKLRDQYYPQTRCESETDDNTWRCGLRTSTWVNTSGAVLIAVLVPRSEADFLRAQAEGNEFLGRRSSWGAEHPVG